MSGRRLGRYLRSGAMAALILVGVGALWRNARPEPRAKFCTTGLAFTTIDGVETALQDQGSPGRDGCDGPDRRSRSEHYILSDRVLGWDCKVRKPDGSVVATTEPNRPDGTCGQPPRR